MDDVLSALRLRFGDSWGADDETALRFSADVEHLLHGLDGAHLVGDPEIEDGNITLKVWVDHPVNDLMTADRLAYEIFGRLSEEIFFAERRFEAGGLRYPFVTGSPRHGHVGALLLFGPHAAAFADRFRQRISGGLRYHA